MGSSMMTKLPPRPVSVPPTEVANRLPPRVVANSNSVFLLELMRVLGNRRWYRPDRMTIGMQQVA